MTQTYICSFKHGTAWTAEIKAKTEKGASIEFVKNYHFESLKEIQKFSKLTKEERNDPKNDYFFKTRGFWVDVLVQDGTFNPHCFVVTVNYSAIDDKPVYRAEQLSDKYKLSF